MTIEQALAIVEEAKPNQVSRWFKLQWLSNLDGRVYAELIRTHQRDQDAPTQCPSYTENTDESTVLLVPPPYDGVYRWYLEAQIDLINLETDKYQNSAALFNQAWNEYARAYHREHMPLDRGLIHQF